MIALFQSPRITKVGHNAFRLVLGVELEGKLIYFHCVMPIIFTFT